MASPVTIPRYSLIRLPSMVGVVVIVIDSTYGSSWRNVPRLTHRTIKVDMRRWAVLLIMTVALTLGACNNRDDKSPAREAGRAEHKIAIETEKVAKKAGKELKEAAHEAREGWKDAKREEQNKCG